MKNLQKLLFIMIWLIFLGSLMAAEKSAAVTWSCMAPDSQKVSSTEGDITGLPQVGSPGFVIRDYNNGPGPEQRWWPYENGAAVSWGGETAQVDTRWIQFAVMPNAAHTMFAEKLEVYLGAKGTNNMRANVYYDTDTNFADAVKLNTEELTLVTDTDSLYSFDISADIDQGDTLFVRVYPWYTGSNSTSKYVYIRNAVISGTSSDVSYPASALWALTDPGQGGTGTTVALSGQITAPEETLNNMYINQYTGPNNSQRIAILGGGWPANQTEQIDTVFVQFSVAPKTGYELTVTSVSLGIAGVSLDEIKANIYYSTSPDFENPTMIEYTTGNENNYLGRDELQPISATIDEFVESGENFYLRVYPWVDNDPSVRTGKYVAIQDVMIGGEVVGTPTAASAEWPFTVDDSYITSGAVLANNVSYSESMQWYSTTTLPTVDDAQNMTVGAIKTVSQSWVAETGPADSLYFQFEATPKYGGTFFIDSVSMYLGAWFTTNMRAEVYYSKDSSFAQKTILFADTALAGSQVDFFGTSLDETINTGESFYIRVYPYNTQAEGWAKLVAVGDVKIMGTTIGVTADPPTVTTAEVVNISTTFAESGGNVSTDGGAAVTAKGVVWNLMGSPTIDDSKTEDGTGSGAFTSIMMGLTPDTTYYVRAYATNDAGTAYGEEFMFTTLDAMMVPTVETDSVDNILVETAESGGNVLAWGGDTVTVRGVCWSTGENPTIADSKTEDGSGLGSYTSTLFSLEAETTYYVRAYATNSIGTGYGEVIEFTTQAPAPDVYKVVAADGSGDYTTVQAAFDDVPDSYTGLYHINVKNGTYYEKLLLDRAKINVVLEGESKENTILTYDDYAGKAGGTSMSYSVAIDADNFTAKNITFRNTVQNDGTFYDQQGVALRVNGDRQIYVNCNLLGYQDTYYTWGGRGTGRTYMKDCYIEGSVDFIFGRNVVLFDSCQININRDGGTLTAASTEAEALFGYVFKDCKITADEVGFDGDAIEDFYLGRPWQNAPRTVFINCEEDAALHPDGWMTWNVTPALYAEYNCYGEGSDYSSRISIGTQLTSEEAAAYTMENIFAQTTFPDWAFDWIPDPDLITDIDDDNNDDIIPTSYALYQNYPNPFNPATTIKYQIPQVSNVKIIVYNILGQSVKTLVNREQAAGIYTLKFDASRLASGVYFLNIKAGDFVQTKKMMLLK